MRELQFREALREAMSEEMRRDKNVFLMGEEVAEYNGLQKYINLSFSPTNLSMAGVSICWYP